MKNNIKLLLVKVKTNIINFFINPFGRKLGMEYDIYDLELFDHFVEQLRNDIAFAKENEKGYGYCHKNLRDSVEYFQTKSGIKLKGWEVLLRKEWDGINI